MFSEDRIRIVVLYIFVRNAEGILRDDAIVKSSVGWIEGIKATDGDYSMYLGIPYAVVDENNPFGPSTPYPHFNEVFKAFDDSFICPQVEEFNNTIAGSLDCLRLNIYVPKTENNDKFPVLVLIHGGGYINGFANRYNYGPKYLVRHDVILVSLNYRLGPYGFMCLHTPRVPGNQGLKDQLLALRWIKNNIEAFGGDTTRITVVGESAGARSIDLHLLSSQEKLFQRAIIQSGSVLNAGWFPEPDLQAPIKLAAALGFITNDLDEALMYLSQQDTDLVIEATRRINVVFRLCLEKDFVNTERFIIDHPLHSDVPKADGISILLGYNSQEAIIGYVDRNPEFYKNLNLFNHRLQTIFNFSSVTLSNTENIVKRFYIGDEKLSDQVNFELADFDSDTSYIYSTHRNIARYINNGANRIYHYVFSYNGGRNFSKRRNNVTLGGASHADERGYLYDIKLFPEEPTKDDQLTIDRMTGMWTNFAKFGDPTPAITELLTVKWEPITKDSAYHYMDIDLQLKTGKRHYHQRMSFWDLFFKTYGEFEIGFRASINNSSCIFIMPQCLLLISLTLTLRIVVVIL